MENQLNNANAVSQLLVERSRDFSQELQTLISNGYVSVRETTDYIAKAISGAGGSIDLVEASTDRKEGVSTFNGNVYKQNVAKVIDAIQISVGKGNPSDFGAIAFDKAAPAELQNAHLIIEQNGRKLLEKKVSDFIPDGTPTNAKELYAELAMPVIIRDQENFDIKLKFPQGSSVGAAASAADTEIVKVAFRAYETGRRS